MAQRLTLIPVLCIALFAACKKNDNPSGSTATAPTISSFSPVMGLAGDTIIINGSDLSTTVAGNTVKFGGNVTASVIEASATQLKVKVPSGAATGNISVSVNNLQATSTASFEVLNDIPRSGLVAFYPFNNNANDASPNGFNLGLYGTYSAVADRFSNAGKAYYFNGGNSFAIASTHTAVQVSQPLTLGAWIKYDSLISSAIVCKYYPSSGFIFYVVANGSLYALIDGAHTITTASGVIPKNTAGQWIFIALTYDGATMKFYKNGANVGSYSYTGTITANTTSSFRIGPDGDGGTGAAAFKCAIDDVTVYNRALSDTEIQQLNAATITKK